MRESVEFNGRTYHRYPDAKQNNHRRYYTSHDKWKSTPRTLHRDVWEFHNGPIPPGHHIHHADGNACNNAPETLICLSSAAHQVEHRAERSARAKTPEQLALLERIRPLASAWHSTEEGRAHARRNAFLSICKDFPEQPCLICGTMYKPKINRPGMCSPECKRERINEQQRERTRLRSNRGTGP